MNCKPLGRKIIVRLEEKLKEVKVGKVIVPDTISENSPKKAVVVKLGNEMNNGKKIPFSVKEGEKVLVSLYGGIMFSEDEALLIVEEDDILAIIEEEVK